MAVYSPAAAPLGKCSLLGGVDPDMRRRALLVSGKNLSRSKVSDVSPSALGPRIRGLRESALLVLSGLAIILFLALVTYDPADPAFSVAGGSQTVSNRVGPAGAFFADLAYLLFGRPAYLFPALVFLAGLLIFRSGKREKAKSRPVLWWRTGGFVLLLATSCGLATLHVFAPDMRETAGGVLGQLAGAGLEQVLGHLGATVLLLVLWIVSVSLATGVSWLTVMDTVGRGVLAGVAGSRALYKQMGVRSKGPQGQAAAPPRGEEDPPRQAKARRTADRTDVRRASGRRTGGAREAGAAVRVRRRPASRRRSRSWTMPRRGRGVIPKRRWRPCRAWWS